MRLVTSVGLGVATELSRMITAENEDLEVGYFGNPKITQAIVKLYSLKTINLKLSESTA